MRILITGTGGFISSAVYRALLNKYPDAELVGTTHYTTYNLENHPDRGKKNNLIVECQLDKLAWVERLLSQFKPDIIIHLSGFGIQDITVQRLYDSHVTSTLNLLDSINQEKPPLFIHMSSIVASLNPLNIYGACKLSAEALVKAYNDQRVVTGVSIRPCAIVGGRSTHGLLPDLLKKLFDNNQTYLKLRSNSCKPFIFIDVFTDFLLKLIENESWQEKSPITISSWDTILVQDIAEIAMCIAKKFKPIQFLGESFSGDAGVVRPFNNLSDYHFGSARDNICLGLKDILKKDYGIKEVTND